MRKKVIITVSLLLVVSFTLAACQRSEIPSSTEQATGDIKESTTKTATQKPTTASTATFESALAIGSTQIRLTDGMEQVYVPASYFIMGSNAGDEDADDDEKPERTVYLDAYWIDKYEVTNGQYEACVATGGCTRPNESKSYFRSSYYGNSEYDNYPVIQVDWNQAVSYCEWVRGDLPTEAQWEKAARGPNGNKYPWGNEEPDSSYANYNDNIGDTTEVGRYEKGASPYGAMDMAGNVMEWVSDWYDDYDANDTNNPQGPSDTKYFRVLRGGGWSNGNWSIRTALRGLSNPSDRVYYAGFRCVSSP